MESREGCVKGLFFGKEASSPKEVAAWDAVEGRLSKRLALWKRSFISEGGLVTLIGCTFTSMPIF